MKYLAAIVLTLFLGSSAVFAATSESGTTSTTTASQKKKSSGSSSTSSTFASLMKDMKVYCSHVETFCQQVEDGELTDAQISSRLASLRKESKAMQSRLNRVQKMNLTQAQQMQIVEMLSDLEEHVDCISYYDL